MAGLPASSKSSDAVGESRRRWSTSTTLRQIWTGTTAGLGGGQASHDRAWTAGGHRRRARKHGGLDRAAHPRSPRGFPVWVRQDAPLEAPPCRSARSPAQTGRGPRAQTLDPGDRRTVPTTSWAKPQRRGKVLTDGLCLGLALGTLPELSRESLKNEVISIGQPGAAADCSSASANLRGLILSKLSQRGFQLA
jgi:hypothetical protein